MFTLIRAPLQARLFPPIERPDQLPPFWELEDLIAAGLDRSAALDILALRRERAECCRLVPSRPGSAEPSSCDPVEQSEISGIIV
jgi:hypothetical protein